MSDTHLSFEDDYTTLDKLIKLFFIKLLSCKISKQLMILDNILPPNNFFDI